MALSRSTFTLIRASNTIARGINDPPQSRLTIFSTTRTIQSKAGSNKKAPTATLVTRQNSMPQKKLNRHLNTSGTDKSSIPLAVPNTSDGVLQQMSKDTGTHLPMAKTVPNPKPAIVSEALDKLICMSPLLQRILYGVQDPAEGPSIQSRIHHNFNGGRREIRMQEQSSAIEDRILVTKDEQESESVVRKPEIVTRRILEILQEQERKKQERDSIDEGNLAEQESDLPPPVTGEKPRF